MVQIRYTHWLPLLDISTSIAAECYDIDIVL